MGTSLRKKWKHKYRQCSQSIAQHRTPHLLQTLKNMYHVQTSLSTINNYCILTMLFFEEGDGCPEDGALVHLPATARWSDQS